MNISVPVGCEVSSVSFSFASSKDIRKLSVKALNNPQTFDPITNLPTDGGLYDPVLGPFDKNEVCTTCKLNSFACPGHFGHIELSVPVYHPLLFKQLFNLLKAKCFCCHSFKMTHAKVHKYFQRIVLARNGYIVESMELGTLDVMEMDIDPDGPSAQVDQTTVVKRIDLFVENVYKKHGFAHRKKQHQPVSLSHDYIRLLIKEFLQAASGVKSCDNCGGKSPALRSESNTKIFKSPLSTRDYSSNHAKGVQPKSIFGELVDSTNDKFVKPLPSEETDKELLTKKSKSIYMAPIEVCEHMKQLWVMESEILDQLYGSSNELGKKKSSFEIFFMEVIPVPPTRFRPISHFGDKKFDHAQNTFLVDIIKNNNAIVDLNKLDKENDDKKAPNVDVFKSVVSTWISLQESVNNMHDSTKNPKGKNSSLGIKQIMEKKEGLFRKHMMGKRVNYAARSVISPDPMLETNEIGIPMVFAKKLSFPEPVTQFNINEMRQAVINGPNIYPGALAVQNEDGSLTSLDRCSVEQRTAIANQLLAPPLNSKSSDDVMYVNKKVHRHLRNGDMLLLNRQPTLHKPSIMAHSARVLPHEKTIRMHYANCNTYNADFDGDEMNVHFPQNAIAQAEARLIMNTDNQYLVPTSGEPLRGLIQDHVVTGVLMTSRDTFLSREDYCELVYSALPESDAKILLLPPAIIKPARLWTGKQVISTVLKNLTNGCRPLNMLSKSQVPGKSWSSLQKKDTEEGNVIIFDGELLTGVLDKKQFGAKPYGLVHGCFEVYGGEIAGKLLSSLGRLFTKYVQYIGFSCRMDDLVVLAEHDEHRRHKITETIKHGRKILTEFAFGENDSLKIAESSIEKQLRHVLKSKSSSEDDKIRAKKTLLALEDKKLYQALEDTIRSDEKLAALDNKMKSKTAAVTTDIVKDIIPNGLLKAFPDNGMQLMTVSGAKGSNVNVTQISCMLGQQELEGRRVPVMVSGKTLPSFRAYDLGPRAGGYITGRFLTGIKPQEYYFHCMAGREGLVDTAVKTARSGYLQRCLIKHMEGLKVHYDSTVRDSADGSVYQFHYGEDSLDVTKAAYLNKFDFNAQNYQAFLTKYNPETAAVALNCHKAVKHARKSLKRPQNYEPTLSKYHPGRYLGSVSDKFYQRLQDYISKNPEKLLVDDNEDQIVKNTTRTMPNAQTFEALMQLKYLHSLVEPGEAVGLLAAQSVGEPSTQMTLNTFHFAGHGAKNVTLGIPRLREIIMTASSKPKTPQMVVPFKKHVSKTDAEKICRRLSRFTLDMILQEAVVTEKVLPLSRNGRMRSYQIRLKFMDQAYYQQEFNLNTDTLQQVLRKQFIKRLNAAVLRDLSLAKSNEEAEEQEIGKGLDIYKFKENMSGPDEEDELKLSKKPKKKLQSILSDDENEDAMDIDASAATRANKKKQKSSYDEPDEEDLENLKVIEEDEIDEIEEGLAMEDNELRDDIVNENQYVFDYSFDKYGNWCELELQFPADTKKILLVSHIEAVAPLCVISEISGISKCFMSENKETGGWLLTTDGVNIEGICEFDDFFDIEKLESNDISAILKRYGVEAARKTIIREISAVFGVYGIEVDTRHLTLIADYMTFGGGYRPFNRIGIESCVSPFAKMTFETTFHFLLDASMRGESDILRNPSARLVVGRVVEGGTGSFEIVQPFQ